MIRLFVRILGLALLAGAFAACVIDGARSIAADQLLFTPTGATAYWAFPNKFPLLQTFVERADPSAACGIRSCSHILRRRPGWCSGLLGAGLFYLVRRRPPPIGHSNRSR